MDFLTSNHASREDIEKVLEIENPVLELQEKHLGLHSLNSFARYNSSQRLTMLGGHLQQIVPILNGDEKMIQSGIEYELGKITHACVTESDCIVLDVVDRYGGYQDNAIPVTQTVLLIYDMENDFIDMINIPYYFSMHATTFGFKYERNEKIMDQIYKYKNCQLDKGTILADTPTKGSNGEYKFGVNANTLLYSIPDVSEDAILISQSFAEKLAYKIFERRSISFGKDMYPLNIYGDKENYKIFPDIGEYVRPEGVLMALRNKADGVGSDLYSIAMSSRMSLMEYDNRFDKVFYVRSGGHEVEALGKKHRSGIIVDIEIYTNPFTKNKKEFFVNIAKNVDRYYDGCKKFYGDMINSIEKIRSNPKYRNKQLSSRLNSYYYRMLALYNNYEKKIKYTNRYTDIDLYHIDFVIEHTIIPNEGSKVTDLQGCKSVIGKILPDDEMPVDQYGNVADIIACPTAPFNRMDAGRLYEQYINGVTINVVNKVKEKIEVNEIGEITSKDKTIVSQFEYVLNYLKLFETEQYYSYKELLDTNNIEDMKHILEEVVNDNLYIYLRSAGDKDVPLIMYDILKSSEYALEPKPILLREGRVKKFSKQPAIIAPIYHILLSKTPDEIAVCLSPRVNSFGFPVKNMGEYKHTQNVRNVSTKFVSETDNRILSSYLDPEAIAYFRMMSNGPITHEKMCQALLTAKHPTNIDKIVDRDKIPYEIDTAMKLFYSFAHAMGLDIVFVEDKHAEHDPWIEEILTREEE